MSKEATINKILTKEVLEREYEALQSFRAIAEKYNISHETVRYYMHKYGLAYNELVRYSCNENFFALDNEASFYVAGFVAADAYVLSHGEAAKNLEVSNTFGIGLARKDENHLWTLKNLLSAESPITYKIVKNSKRNPNWKDSEECELRITSIKLCTDLLLRFNIVQRKSLILIFPEWLLNHPLVHHFMRGYFDGDGSFYKTDGVNIEQVYFNVRGTIEFLTSFRNILDKNCSLSTYEKQIRISSGYPALEYGGNGVAAEISNFLYKDATIYLPRKYELAQQAIKQTETTKEKAWQVQFRREEERCLAFKKKAHRWFTHAHPTSSNQLQEIYEEKGTVRGVAKALGVRLSTAREQLMKNNIEIVSSSLDIDPDRLKALYQKHGQLVLVAKELNCDPQTVTKYMKDFGLDFSSSRAHEHNHSFFAKENESREQFYWAGYLLGNSSFDMKTNCIRVSCKEFSEIEKFQKAGITTSPISKYATGHFVTFVSPQILNDLERFGITSKKNEHYEFPEWLVQHEYFREFLCGRLNRNGRLTLTAKSIEFTGNKEYLQVIRDHLIKELHLKTANEIRANKYSFRICYTGAVVQPVVGYLQFS